MKITHRWFHCALLLIALVLLGNTPVFSAAANSDILGSVWQQSENGWSGVWTRRGTSDIFDALWTKNGQQVTAVLTMTRTGADTVSIYRKDTSDSFEVDYTATIGRDGSVTGSAKVRSTGSTCNWTARIQGNTERTVSDILGSVWQESENGWSGVWTRRGTSDVFDALWTKNGQQVTAVLTMTRTGADTVSIYRKDTSDSFEVDYTATIGKDGSVTGSGKIRSTGFIYNWTAMVQ